ncbi:MAG: GNAT family N-acetyltransferase [Clostridia bacterium]|nr:GNAT family N-acetyltransferase [Clostridia bacterium]
MTEVRGLKMEELAAYNKLSSICFTYCVKTENLTPNEMSSEKLRQYRGCFDEDGTLLGGMILLDMNCRFEGNTCRFFGVGGVVTDPAERRRGAIRQIFEADLPRMYEEGFVLSALYPFSHEFYRKFGYELGILRHTMKFSPGSLRKDLHRAAAIRRILSDEPDGGMKQVYERYMADKNLGILRSDEQWKELRGGTPWENQKHSYVLYNEADEPIAYWIGTMSKGGDESLLSIDDLAYVSREGMEAIFAMLRSMNEVGTVKLVAPQDMPIRYLVADPYHVDEECICGGMVRIVNVEQVLGMLPAPALTGSCTVEVSDGQIAANNGRFTISGDGETLTVTRTENAPDLRCTIGGLSALAVNAMDLQQCLDARLAELVQPDNRRFMAELFRARKQHLHNYF